MIDGSKVVLLANKILVPFYRVISEFYNPAARDTDQMIVMIMSKHIFIAHRALTTEALLHEAALDKEWEGPVDGGTGDELALSAEMLVELVGAEMTSYSCCAL